MIVVKLMGGLGNQMFQYAAGRCLSHLHKTELKLDTTFLDADAKDNYTKRELALDAFNIQVHKATESDLRKFNLSPGRIMRTMQIKLPVLFNTLTVIENSPHFHKEFTAYPKNTYLNGYWQSEKYFSEIREILLKEFTLKEPLSRAALELANEIKNLNSVSLHVRRGDYVNLKSALEFHGLCSVEYYRNAINYMENKYGNTKLYVFSDDIQWCKDSLNLPAETVYVSGLPAAVDMHLMSLCRHNIIANSSFSWWGAWLNTTKDKTVIAPAKWYAARERNSSDIYPVEWVKLEG